jgi:tRNA pseudouridine38-40 synthase
MPRYKLTIEYDGTPYCGWQRQNEQLGVQEALEAAVAKFCEGASSLTCAGRTDAGVHALGQVAHVDLPIERPVFNIRQGVNFYLMDTPIVVIAAEEATPEFHARFDAKEREYLYRILNRPAQPALEKTRVWHVHQPLDIQAMREAAAFLIGHHDFTSFRASECQSASPSKTLDVLEIHSIGQEVRIVARARSFLHHQVRNLVGTLALVGQGKWRPEQVKQALEARDRRAAGPTAPPQGLYLVRVGY